MEHLKEFMDDYKLMQPMRDSSQSPYPLPFIHRDQEVVELSVTLINNSMQAAIGVTDDNQDFTMPFLIQNSGAGKTTFGNHLLEEASSHRDAIYQKLVKSPGYENHIDLINTQVDKFIGATFVHVSLSGMAKYVNSVFFLHC